MHDFLVTVLLAGLLLLTFVLYGCSNAREPLTFVEPSYSATNDAATPKPPATTVATVPARD